MLYNRKSQHPTGVSFMGRTHVRVKDQNLNFIWKLSQTQKTFTLYYKNCLLYLRFAKGSIWVFFQFLVYLNFMLSPKNETTSWTMPIGPFWS